MSAFDDIADGTYTGVVDAIEDGLATLFVEADGDEIGSVVVAPSVLPERGRHADAVLSLTIEDGELVAADYEPNRTTARRDTTQNRFDRLSRRLSDDE